MNPLNVPTAFETSAVFRINNKYEQYLRYDTSLLIVYLQITDDVTNVVGTLSASTSLLYAAEQAALG